MYIEIIWNNEVQPCNDICISRFTHPIYKTNFLSSSDNVFNRNGLLQQQEQEGNDIIIYPTPATMNTRTTTSSLATDDEDPAEGHARATVKLEKNETIVTADSSNSNLKTRKRNFGSKPSAYFQRLFLQLFNSGNKGDSNANNITDAMHDIGNTYVEKKTTTIGCLPFNRWRNLKLKKRRNQEFLWCFRPVGTTAAFQSSASSSSWTEFEKKNQIELSRQLRLLSNRITTHASFEIQDKHIFDGTMVMTVMLKEGMAFVLDPEWSMPITYEIIFKPKLNWYQEIRIRLEYQRWLKEQQKRQHLP